MKHLYERLEELVDLSELCLQQQQQQQQQWRNSSSGAAARQQRFVIEQL
jgi:hypothetical protein